MKSSKLYRLLPNVGAGDFGRIVRNGTLDYELTKSGTFASKPVLSGCWPFEEFLVVYEFFVCKHPWQEMLMERFSGLSFTKCVPGTIVDFDWRQAQEKELEGPLSGEPIDFFRGLPNKSVDPNLWVLSPENNAVLEQPQFEDAKKDILGILERPRRIMNFPKEAPVFNATSGKCLHPASCFISDLAFQVIPAHDLGAAISIQEYDLSTGLPR